MKVVCIDGKHNDPLVTYYLPEGVPLDVYQCPTFCDTYRVSGYDHIKNTLGGSISWRKRRFIPLSQIDELEILEQRENTLVTK